MFLKNFKLQGFKSFKDRTTLEFKEGITTIVGPNGSGKSNIADAFRWVLGEQRIKALRGNKGEDVIFGGTMTEKPLGVASVVMEIDNGAKVLNTPYEEVSIGRKIYRSGESEYTINGAGCRLKDIHELFNDTGLGKNSFSIIGQGEIDRILNAKPEERRGMVEEIAGIIKYRLRKEESLRKIDHAKLDLTRVLDIIYELDSNFTHLEKESSKAENYLSLKEESDALELNLLVSDIKESEGVLETLEAEIKVLEDSISKASSHLSERETLYEQNKMSQFKLEESLKEKRESLLSLKDRLGTLNTQMAEDNMRLKTLDDNEERIQKEIDEIVSKKDKLANIYADKLKEQKSWEESISTKEEEIKGVNGTLNEKVREKDTFLNEAKEIHYEIIDLFQTIAVLNNEITSVDEEKAHLERRSQDFSLEKEALIKEKEDFFRTFSDKEKSKEELEASYEKAVADLEGLDERRKSLEEEKVVLDKSYKEAGDSYQNIYSKHRALEEIQKGYQGYFTGVKNILQAKDREGLKGIHGVVGDLIQVDSHYEKAMEIALGGGMQNIVTDNSASAKKAVEYLKKSNGGRCTFLPLDTIKERTLGDNLQGLLKEQGVLGIGSQLIKVEARYQKAMAHLLGNILIVDTMETGMAIAKKSGYRVKIVTLDGEQFNPGGSLTGGNTGKSSSILGRNRELKELEAQLREAHKKRREWEDRLNALTGELYPLAGKIEASRSKLRSLEAVLINERQEIEVKREQGKRFEEKMELLILDAENALEEIDGLMKEKGLLEKTLLERNQEKDEKEALKEAKEKAGEGLNEEITKLQEAITHLRMDKATLEEKKKALEESLAAFYEEQDDIMGLAEKKKETLGAISEERETIIARKEGNEVQKLEWETTSDSLIIAIDTGDKEKDVLYLDNVALEKEVKEKSGALRKEEDLLHEKDIKRAKKETERENKIEALFEKFDLLPGEAERKAEPIEDKGAAYKRLKYLVSEISRLGPVNTGAIEEFKRVEERLTFLKVQEKDLQTSIDSLEGIVEEINSIMRTKFEKSFHELNAAFKETFAALFSGGEAHMELDDSEDILNCGIEIYAKPPGKTPKSLSSLSGGERALTAMALLFSLLKIKPSPLCIIDEADASLDENNVINFANYLKDYSGKTQFLVISHRQGTIEGSDNLYGVTMDKSGVSKMISVTIGVG